MKKKIMAVEEKQIENSLSEVPSDNELFAGEVHRKLSEREVFVGDEDFYGLLAKSLPTSPTKRTDNSKRSARIEPVRHKLFSTLQKAFIAGIIIIEAVLVYVVFKSLLRSTQTSPTPVAQQVNPSDSQNTDLGSQQVIGTQKQPVPFFTSTQPISLKVAREFYLLNDYTQAYAAYNQLFHSIPSGTEEELVRDFLQFKMAVCLNRMGNKEEAKALFRILSNSRSPAITVVANYNMGLLQLQEKQYLKARNSIYNTIAVINAVDFDKDFIYSLQCDCNFLIAETMTRNILSLCDADTDMPPNLWSISKDVDPFTNYEEAQLRVLLNSGFEQLKQGLLSPKIRKLEHSGILSYWYVVAYGASVEELLARFSANADLDISWSQNIMANNETIGNAVRKRPVRLYLPSATVQQVVQIAAGHVGLLSRLNDKRLLNISNPADYSSLSEYINLLVQDTIYLWRNFLLAYPEEKLVPNAHFALGLLHTQEKESASAIAEYKLVANQFSQTSLAPFALLSSSKIKAGLYDYSGAREDLTQLVEQYPDTEFYGQACMNLADASKKAGFVDEAGKLYRKVYNLGLTTKLQIDSTFGAGRCSFEIEDYENASKWLVRYLNLTNGQKDDNFYLAYYLLGKTNMSLGKPKQAIRAFQCALSGPVGSLSRERYVETVTALVEVQIELENFVEALTLLENINSWQFSKEESLDILILKSKVLRNMGLPDKAIIVLGDHAEYLPASELKNKMKFELANCYIAKGDVDLAHGILTEILMSADSGLLRNEIILRLAEVCLLLDQSDQTVTVCRQLLDAEVSENVKQKARKVLAAAYHKQKNFENAALVLVGQR